MHLTNRAKTVYCLKGSFISLAAAGTVLFSPFLLQIDTFDKVTQMSDRHVLCKTEKLRYLDKLRLSEPVQTPGSHVIA